MGKKLPDMCVVLYYHAITRDDRPRFARQVDLIKRLAKPIPANTKETLTDGVHHVVVTFDDGFQSILENALPELIERRIPSTIFFPAGYLGRRPDWIKDESHEGRSEVVMTEEQIRDLPPEHILVGSHTMTHPNLNLLGEDEMRRELTESREELQRLTGRSITLLSFPFGEYDTRVVEMARLAGYEQLFGILPILSFLEEKECVIGRVSVKPSDWPLEFRLKMLGAYRWLAWTHLLKRKLGSFMSGGSSQRKTPPGVENQGSLSSPLGV